MPSIFDRWGKQQNSGSVFDRWSKPQQAEADQGGGVLDSVLDVVSTPGRMTAGAIRAGLKGENPLTAAMENRPTFMGGTREDDFDDVLADSGMEDSLGRRALGLGLDLVVDPLNLVNPIAPVVKGAKALAQSSGVVDAVKGSRLVKELGEKFVPQAGLEKFVAPVGPGSGAMGASAPAQALSYKDMRRLHGSALDDIRQQRGREALDMFDDVTNDEAKAISYALDEGIQMQPGRDKDLVDKAKLRFEQQFQKEVAAKVMPPSAHRQDYVTHLLSREAMQDPVNVRALTGKNPFQARKELSLQQGIDAGVFKTDDIRQIMAERLAKGDRAIENQKFFEQTAKLFGQKFSKNQPPPPGWVKPSFAAEPQFKHSMRGVYVPAEIARDLEKLVEIPKAQGAIGEMATAATALWKGYATRANVGFHTRNAVSNMMQTWMGGLGDTGTKVMDLPVVIAKHVQAARLLHDPAKIGDIGAYTGDEIREAISKYGVTSSTHSSFNEIDDVIKGEIDHAGKGFVARNLNPLDRRNALLRGGAEAGTAVENTSRLALFIDQLEKGQSLEQAALHVRKYLFDYSELTDFERKIRDRALPFYTWLRKNIPLQVDNVLNQPDKMAAIADVYDSVEDSVSDQGMGMESPEWMKDYQQLPFNTDEGAGVFVNPNLPIQDLNKLVPDLQKDVLAAVNPLARIPLELATNRQFFTGSPIYDERLGPMGDFKQAHPLAQVVGLPGVDIAQENREGAEELPAIVDYAMRQAPPLTQFGKLAAALGPEQDQNVKGVDVDAVAFAGLPTRTVTKEQAREQKKLKKNDEKSRRTVERKEQRRFKKSEVRDLYERYKQQ